MRLGNIAFIVILLLLAVPTVAQNNPINMAEHDDKQYYFGITFATNISEYRMQYSASFANTDTFKRIQPEWQPGFNLGLLGNLRLSRFIDLRFVPALEFTEKRIVFNMAIPNDSTSDRSMEAINMDLPVQLKFKSDRIKNFRFYGLLGGKFDYDLSSNTRSHRTDQFIKVSPIDAGYEIGVGFEFFNPNFIFSPEIKLSQGLINQLYRDPDLPLTTAIETLKTRTIVISIHLEG
jgi:hypothetical protein